MVHPQILWWEQFNNTSQYQSVCIVLGSLEKEFGKQNKLLELLTAVNSRRYVLIKTIARPISSGIDMSVQ